MALMEVRLAGTLESQVMEEHQYYPVGGEEPEPTEARVLAATHRTLGELITDGRFREDLYYRLRVVEITVPPLRDRTSDLPILVEHLVRRAASTLHRRSPVLSRESLEALRLHSWPGNVRELENCLTRAVVVCTGDVIPPEHLAIGPARAGNPENLSTLALVEKEHL